MSTYNHKRQYALSTLGQLLEARETNAQQNTLLIKLQQQLRETEQQLDAERRLNTILTNHINLYRETDSEMPNPNINEDIEFAQQQVDAGRQALTNPDIDPKVAERVKNAILFWQQKVDTLSKKTETPPQ
ncbi:hypothetical protein UFOVP526_34 [uncultured Caudovirales phage]|uniref:Uncharacterized protein n=1 Tax=uncultured Caudovirales phage TaxID=2100421 RepID=A0A6J5MV34_9CAUD|nr:hypothetical protein UFOVP526_34 [uncultured Caudovirales phage]